MMLWTSLALAGSGFGGMPVWKALPGKNTCPAVYDYFPDGGFVIFMCHARTGMSWSALQEHAPVAPFLSGPHTASALDLENNARFGHYDPAFVRWLGDFAIPTDAATVKALQPIYDANIRPLARTTWQSRQKLEGDPACRDAERKRYAAAMDQGRAHGYVERWYDFLAWEGCAPAQGDVGDGNVVKTGVGWWLRREMDGTADAWAAHLERLLRTFDAAWLDTLTSGPAVQGLRIPPGRHSTIVAGTVKPGEIRQWMLDARPEQVVTLAVTSEHRVAVGLSSPGKPSTIPSDQAVWTGRLPTGPGPYTITLSGTGPYELFVGVW